MSEKIFVVSKFFKTFTLQVSYFWVCELFWLKEDKAPEDRIYFMDRVHAMHNSQPAYGWIKKGKEAILKINTERQRVNITGAYDIENQKVVRGY